MTYLLRLAVGRFLLSAVAVGVALTAEPTPKKAGAKAKKGEAASQQIPTDLRITRDIVFRDVKRSDGKPLDLWLFEPLAPDLRARAPRGLHSWRRVGRGGGAGHGFRGDNVTPSVAEINRRTVDFFLKDLTAPQPPAE